MANFCILFAITSDLIKSVTKFKEIESKLKIKVQILRQVALIRVVTVFHGHVVNWSKSLFGEYY